MHEHAENHTTDRTSNTSRRRLLRTTGAIAAASLFGSGIGAGIVGAEEADGFRDLCEAVHTDVCLVVDVSGSMMLTVDGSATAPPGESRLDIVQEAMHGLVSTFDESDKVSLVPFSTEVDRQLDLTVMDDAGKEDLRAVIDDLDPYGWTNTQGGIIFGADELLGRRVFDEFAVNTDPSGAAREDAEKVMIILADGESNRYFTESGALGHGLEAITAASEAATRAKDEGIRIFTVGFGEAAAAEMEDLASSPDDAFFDEEMADLPAVLAEISAAICPTEVDLEITPNAIQPNRRGVIQVAVHTTAEVDATTLEPDSLRFGSPDTIVSGAGARVSRYRYGDVTGDGNANDFVGQFPVQDAGFEPGDEEGWLTGETAAGEPIAGRDGIRTVGGGRP